LLFLQLFNVLFLKNNLNLQRSALTIDVNT
jgi:hypothetical protein